MQYLTPIVLPFRHKHACLDYILQHCSLPTILIICSTREAFLDSLLHCNHCRSTSLSSPSPLSEQDFHCQYLVEPTIGLLSLTRSIQLAFCPTLQHLRAYLSAFTTSLPSFQAPSADSTVTSPRDDKFPILALFDPLTLHRSTLEFSAQGISRSLAVAVEAAARANVRLVIAELGDVPETLPDMHGPRTIWEERVPLLSTTLRTMGNGDKGFMGRSVALRKVVAQWCIFEDSDKDDKSTSG